jgi:hypothetical protein
MRIVGPAGDEVVHRLLGVGLLRAGILEKLREQTRKPAQSRRGAARRSDVA